MTSFATAICICAYESSNNNIEEQLVHYCVMKNNCSFAHEAFSEHEKGALC